jgi:hypothetical protein
VPSLDDALVEQLLEPVHVPFRALFADGRLAAIVDGSAATDDIDAFEDRVAVALAAVAGATGTAGDPIAVAVEIRADVVAALTDGTAPPDAGTDARAADAEALTRQDRATLLLYLVLSRSGALAPGADVAATSLAWYDELRLAPVIEDGLRSAGLVDAAVASAVAKDVRGLLALPRPSGLGGRGRHRELRLLDRWLASEPIRVAVGVTTWDGEEWLDRDRFASWLSWAQRLDTIETGAPADPAHTSRLLAAAEAAGYRVDRLRAALSESDPAVRSPSRSRRATRPRGES